MNFFEIFVVNSKEWNFWDNANFMAFEIVNIAKMLYKLF